MLDARPVIRSLVEWVVKGPGRDAWQIGRRHAKVNPDCDGPRHTPGPSRTQKGWPQAGMGLKTRGPYVPPRPRKPGLLLPKGRGEYDQNGLTITRMTMTAAAMPGTSLISRNCLPVSLRSPRASFFE